MLRTASNELGSRVGVSFLTVFVKLLTSKVRSMCVFSLRERESFASWNVCFSKCVLSACLQLLLIYAFRKYGESLGILLKVFADAAEV